MNSGGRRAKKNEMRGVGAEEEGRRRHLVQRLVRCFVLLDAAHKVAHCLVLRAGGGGEQNSGGDRRGWRKVGNAGEETAQGNGPRK